MVNPSVEASLVPKRFLLVQLMLLAPGALGGPPHVPPRDYSRHATVVLGDEAVALSKATEAALAHLRKRSPRASLGAYYAHVERLAPSAWVVTWMLNDIDARGGAVEVTLDATAEKVVGVRDIE
jgi:hypothetical protein